MKKKKREVDGKEESGQIDRGDSTFSPVSLLYGHPISLLCPMLDLIHVNKE
jgi:hypothetical protein